MNEKFDPMTGKPIEAANEPEVKFDPMTGKPIEAASEPEVKFDPMTGKPLEAAKPEASGTQTPAEAQAAPETQNVSEPEMNFDPMTGKPLEAAQPEALGTQDATQSQAAPEPQNANEPEMNFDPMTGKPIGAQQNTNDPEMNFDPMTGKPIGAQQNANGAEMNFDPMTGKPIGGNGAPAKKAPKKIVWIVGGVAAVAVVVVAGVCSGAFLSKQNKILLATKNTLEDMPQVVQDVNFADIVASGKYTVGVKADIEGEGFEGTLKCKDAQMQADGTVSISGMGDIDFLVNLDDEQISASIPMLTDDILVYNYTEEKDGYIVDLLGEDGIASIDSALSEITSPKEQSKVAQEVVSVIYDEYKALDIKNADKEEFKVDGKDRKCKGYEFTVTEDNVLNVLDGIEDIYDEYYEEAADTLDVDMGYVFSELRSEVRGMEDINVEVYVYKNKLAAVVAGVEDYYSTFTLLFQGGDCRMQNIKLIAEDRYDEYSVFELKGKTKDSKETYDLSIGDGTYEIGLTYNHKSGDYSLDYRDYWSSLYAEGNLQSSSKGVTFTLDELGGDGASLNTDIEVSVSKGAQFEKMSGDTLDIGNLSESDLRELVLGMQDYL